ncbi:GM25042 [Drosophila sechellia]|uniref:GM25042 n=1 Tax=Drosophila sechellia TaxID=7238 RepID=B4HJG6_DROSE|nr:GM25042 [Drosophila sechellia]
MVLQHCSAANWHAAPPAPPAPLAPPIPPIPPTPPTGGTAATPSFYFVAIALLFAAAQAVPIELGHYAPALVHHAPVLSHAVHAVHAEPVAYPQVLLQLRH